MSRAEIGAGVGSSSPQRREGPEGSIVAQRYRLLACIGSGSMGDVYEAEHVRLGCRVAIKLLHRGLLDDARAARRFQREARALASVESEYVVGIIDCGTLDDGIPFLVLERLVGEDLRSLLSRSGPLAVPRALHIGLDACAGLSAVHARGIVHRDVKPANLFVTRRSNGEEVSKILDFGVAKVLSTDVTHPGTVIGTMRYMAPEQLTDGASVDATTDVYAVGAVLYECLTGVAPHGAGRVEELMFQILNHDPLPIAERRDELPAELDAIVSRALARDPKQRHPTIEDLARDLARLVARRSAAAVAVDLVDSTQSTLSEPPAQISPRRARQFRGAVLLAVLVTGIALGHGTAAMFSQHPGQARAAAVAPPSPPAPSARVAREAVPRAGALSGASSTKLSPMQVTSLAPDVPVPGRPAALQTKVRPRVPPPSASRAPAAAVVLARGMFDLENPYAE